MGLTPSAIAADANDSRVAVASANGDIWLFDAINAQVRGYLRASGKIIGQGIGASLAFGPDDNLYLYDPTSGNMSAVALPGDRAALLKACQAQGRLGLMASATGLAGPEVALLDPVSGTVQVWQPQIAPLQVRLDPTDPAGVSGDPRPLTGQVTGDQFSSMELCQGWSLDDTNSCLQGTSPTASGGILGQLDIANSIEDEDSQ
jgi:hypothetical protein